MAAVPRLKQERFALRLAVSADIPALTGLIEHSVRRLVGQVYNLQQVESSLRYVFGVDTQLIRDGTYFVVEAGSELVGCGGWGRRKALYGGDQAKTEADADDVLNPAVDAAKIRAFFVHPAWVRRGIGGRLMRACEDAAREAGFQTLELMATLSGVPLYAAYGFRAVETIDAVLPDGVVFPVQKMVKRIGWLPEQDEADGYGPSGGQANGP